MYVSNKKACWESRLLMNKSILFSMAALFILLLSAALPIYGQDWKKKDMGFAFSQQKQLLICDGRNDGVIRVYSGDDQNCAGNIYEFSYAGPDWTKISFGGNLCNIHGFAFGDGRNMGEKRLYAAGYNLAEYTYGSGSWNGGTFGPYVQWTNDIVLGNARNDGVIRIYVAEWDGILELTYNNGNWDELEINTGGQSIGKLMVIDGRNDGVLRLYAASDWSDHVYEYTWSGSEWLVDDCGASGAIAFYDMDVGKGRNDGVKRIYLAANWGGIYELSYNGQNWQYVVIANPAPYGYVGTVAVGSGRNDNTNRIYAGYSPSVSESHLSEFTFNGTWSMTSSIDSGLGFNDITLGQGRNDGKNRIYTSGSDNHVYEYSFENPVPDIKANGSDTPITILKSDTLSITIELDAGSYIGQDADWWIIAESPRGWFYYNPSKGWRPGKNVSYQKSLVDTPNQEVLNKTGLVKGSYTFYFGVDLVVNGQINKKQMFYDKVKVTII